MGQVDHGRGRRGPAAQDRHASLGGRIAVASENGAEPRYQVTEDGLDQLLEMCEDAKRFSAQEQVMLTLALSELSGRRQTAAAACR